MNSNFKAEAIEYVKQAVEEDNGGNYAKAFPLYMNALEYFKTHLKYEKNPKIKEAITQKFTEYLRRADEIRALLDHDGPPPPASSGHGKDSEQPKQPLQEPCQGFTFTPGMYGNFKEQAMEYVKQAVKEDNAGNYCKAFPLYMNALEYFKTHLKYEKNPKIKEAITQKFTEYFRRAEEILAVLDHGGSRPASSRYRNDSEQAKLPAVLNSAIIREKPDVKWNDVAGLESAKQALQEAVILPVKFPQFFTGFLPSATDLSISQQEQSSGQVALNPYALHHSDTSNLVLVTELLTDDNYVSWSRSMMLALSIKNKLGFIDGTIPRPTGELLPLWIRNNHMVIAWILNSVSKAISSSILFSDSARAIWLDLKDRFQKRNGPRIFHLKRELATIKQDSETVTMYFAKIKSIWDEYVTYKPGCTCGRCSCGGVQKIEEFFQLEYLMSFLMGLNSEFSHARSQVLLMDPLPSVNKTFSLIAQEDEHRSVNRDASSTITLAVGNTGSNNATRGAQPAPNNYNSNNNQRSRNRPICTHCGIQGHTVDKCYKIHGYPPGYRQKGTHRSTSAPDSFQQCQNMINLLQSKLTAVKTEAEKSEATTSYLAGKRRPWRAFLFYGPPGTGKSYLAKAAATEASVTIFSISSSDLVSKWMGEGDKLVSNLFQMARDSAPSIIFIDEIDSLCGQQGEGNENEASRRIKTELLVQMQGVGHKDQNVLILAATNTPYALDQVIRQQFDKRIYIHLPDLKARQHMFKVHLGDTQHNLTETEFENLASRTDGFSGSDISVCVRNVLSEHFRKTQDATFFIKTSVGMWEPCGPKQPGAVQITMQELAAKGLGSKILHPPITGTDFDKVLSRQGPTVSKADLEVHERFTKEFGEEG